MNEGERRSIEPESMYYSIWAFIRILILWYICMYDHVTGLHGSGS